MSKNTSKHEGGPTKGRYAEPQGHGGETHQSTDDAARTMTTQQGVPIADDQNSLRAGERGPTLLEDFILREKILDQQYESSSGANDKTTKWTQEFKKSVAESAFQDEIVQQLLDIFITQIKGYKICLLKYLKNNK